MCIKNLIHIWEKQNSISDKVFAENVFLLQIQFVNKN